MSPARATCLFIDTMCGWDDIIYKSEPITLKVNIFIASDLLSKEGKLTTHDGKTVTDLFPEFRPGQVLRFSRLFGPAKASSMPQQWRNAKKRKKKKKKQGEDEKTVIEPPKSPLSPRPEDCMSDDEVSQMLFKEL